MRVWYGVFTIVFGILSFHLCDEYLCRFSLSHNSVSGLAYQLTTVHCCGSQSFTSTKFLYFSLSIHLIHPPGSVWMSYRVCVV